jgi:hypothetical protein
VLARFGKGTFARQDLLRHILVVDRIEEARIRRPARLVFLFPGRGAHPAVAIARLAIANPHAVDHPVPFEYVVIALRPKLRVGPIPQKHAIQIGRQTSHHLQIVGRDFFMDRGKVVHEKRIVRGLRIVAGAAQMAATPEKPCRCGSGQKTPS